MIDIESVVADMVKVVQENVSTPEERAVNTIASMAAQLYPFFSKANIVNPTLSSIDYAEEIYFIVRNHAIEGSGRWWNKKENVQ